MLRRIWVVATKELRQVRRDRLTLAMMVALPVLQLLLFGFAINTDVRHIPSAVYDQDRTARSRDLWRSLEATGFYDVVGQVQSYEQIEAWLRQGSVQVAIVIPPEFSSDLLRNRSTAVQLIVDGSDPQTVASARDTAQGLLQGGLVDLVTLAPSATHSQPRTLRAEPAIWYNPDLRTAVFIVPGLTGVILTLTMVMLTSMAIARERERGTLEQLIVSPIKRLELILGKILPYIVIGYLQMSLILLTARYVFDVHIVGSLSLLYALAALFIAANLALGLLFSTLVQTQQQAMQMSFFFLLPNILLTGFMFPFQAMPAPVQWLSQALPLTHFLRVVRGIALKGAGLADLTGDLAWLAGALGVFVTLASLRFRKRLA
jgi:ABC-2 type transport system permease protein